MTKRILIVFACFSFSFLRAQVPVFDKLEMLYSQSHYKIVYRKANRLLDVPDYDYSHIPEFYIALSSFQLSQDEHWLVRHPNALEDAAALLKEIKRTSDGQKMLSAHIVELSFLKRDLFSWAEDLKRRGKKEAYERLNKVMIGLFDDIPDIDFQGEISPDELSDDSNAASDLYFKERDAVLEIAKKQLGVPYVWAGSDPTGFDCSGFTGYVMKQSGKELPRRAAEQYESSRKVKPKNVQKGDLVFFDSGSGISHVGLIISEKGKPLVMIHASSSKGVIITEIEQSDYWLTRLCGFGTFMY
jgi:hypothetical protein